MKLTAQRSSHNWIGTDYERKVNSWEIKLEETDFDPAIRERFSSIEVEQFKGVKPELITTFRGNRTNWFDSKTKDKQKLFIIDAVTNFIQNNTHALVAQWSEQSAHN